MRFLFLRISAALLILLGAAGLIWAQAETGQITGTVMDPSGATVPNAAIKVHNIATAAERISQSTSAGDFAVTNLDPGDYEVDITAPGFATYQQRVSVFVGGRASVEARLKIGQTGTVVQVTESAVPVNTETQELQQTITPDQMQSLPTLTRNPYDFVGTSGNVSPTDPSGRGAGYAINGLRAAGTNVLLDGVANNDEFGGMVGQAVPLDSVQELGIITNNFTAEYGRADAGIVNVATRAGTNDVHGSVYEFGRYSDLASNFFESNALGIPKAHYTRNQFGFALGGPIKKDKLFFFNNTEWTRVRSFANEVVLTPDPALISAAASNVQSIFSTLGKFAPGVTTLQTYSRNQMINVLGQDPCSGGAAAGGCLAYDPNAPMFDLVNYNVPNNSGAGVPQNTYNTVSRVDYNLSDRTQFYVRYALYSEFDFAGSNSNSPYAGFDTGQTIFNNSLAVSMTHSFSPTFISQTKLDFNRFNNVQPLGPSGVVPGFYLGAGNVATVIGTYDVALPGYLPFAPGSAIPFGGPQNFGQAYQDFNWTKGSHEFRFGGSGTYLRDNRTFGAYEEAIEQFGHDLGSGIDNLLAGDLYSFEAAINPQGKYPCVAGVQTSACTVTLPVQPPTFERSNRYHEGAAYFQDTWKVKKTFTLDLGLRWEYFGVQHNVNPALDSNFYLAGATSIFDQPAIFSSIANGVVDTVPNSPIHELWKPSLHNFAPRVGFAWDLTGDGKTSLRGGYGIGYERNFGNVTFNVIQNPPNYAVLDLFANTSGVSTIPATLNNAGPLAGSSGTAKLPATSLRAVDPNIGQAYAHLISAALEHQFGSSQMIQVSYSGSIGENLYDIGGVNIPGLANVYEGIPGTRTRINDQYGNINYRGSFGHSDYNGLNLLYQINDIRHSGLSLRANYTWSHAEDDLSDTFSSSANHFNLGYTDPFHPMVDWGDADFDLRQRFVVAGTWQIPFAKGTKGFVNRILDGWQISPIVSIRSGSPYTIYDITNNTYIYTRLMYLGQINPTSNTARTLIGPDTYSVFNFPANDSLVDESYVNPITGTADFGPFPPDMTGRNAFRTPGYWTFNASLSKITKITERVNFELRLEAYNVFNHSNFEINTGNAYIAGVNLPASLGGSPATNAAGTISGGYGINEGTDDNRNIQLAARFTF